MICLLTRAQLKDAVSPGTNACVTAYSKRLQPSMLLLSEAAHVDHMLQANANKKGQAQVFCFFPPHKTMSLKI